MRFSSVWIFETVFYHIFWIKATVVSSFNLAFQMQVCARSYSILPLLDDSFDPLVDVLADVFLVGEERPAVDRLVRRRIELPRDEVEIGRRLLPRLFDLVKSGRCVMPSFFMTSFV